MKIEESQPRWGILIGLFVLLGALAALPFFLVHPPSSPPYEIQHLTGQVEVFSSEKSVWVPARQGASLVALDKIRTGPASEADIRVPEQVHIRIKENSEVEVRKPAFLDRATRFRLHLVKGNLLGSTDEKFKGERLEISTPTLVAAVLGTVFQIEANPQTQESTVRVLRGSVTVRSLTTRKAVVVHDLQKTVVKASAPPLQPVRVSRKEWEQAKEAYELAQKSEALEAKQIDLSKEAGSVFQYVFDTGAFYTPNLGFADREFVKDNGKVHLDIKYDVFPAGSFVGMYMKTRGLDLSKFRAIKFQARGNPEEGFPEAFRIELKWKQGLITAFQPRNLKKGWQTFEFPLGFRKPTLVSEITIVFSNDKVGNHKAGVLHLKDLDLVPLS